MIQLKANTNTPVSGLQLGNVDAGCCIDTVEGCLYRFAFVTTPTTFTTITVDGVAYEFAHTYSTPEALENAIIETLNKPTTQGGAGLVLKDGDIKVYLDSFHATADRLTIDMISGVVITNFITNVGTQTSATPVCTPQTMCVHRGVYTLTEAVSIVIDNKALTLATYATVALFRTAVLAQITAQGLDGIAKAVVRAGTAAGTADFWIYAKSGVKVYHDGVLLEQGECSAHYV